MKFFDIYDTMYPWPGQPFSVPVAAAQQRFYDKGPEAYGQQDMGKASDPSKAIFQRRWLPIVDELDTSRIVAIFQSADTSMGKNDPLAIVTGLLMNTGHIVIADVFEEVMEFGAQKAILREKYEFIWQQYRHQPMLIIEQASSGEPIASDLIAEMGARGVIELHPVHKSKRMRYIAIQGAVMSGQVLIWKHCQNAEKLITDMSNAPYDTANDHIPDAVAQLVSHIKKQHVRIDNKPHLLVGKLTAVQQVMALLEDSGPNYPTGISDGNGFSDFEGSFDREDY
jgi:phage terminase large subunit-like protein